jgi:hypothetical protein
MFDPVVLDHDVALNRLAALITRLDRRRVADAFLASLSRRRLDWRSALGSFAVFEHMQLHSPTESSARCGICGLYLNEVPRDLNVLNFERCKWGGVRHDHVNYALLDLELFLESDPPNPTLEDIELFRNMIAAISAAESTVTSAALQSQFASVFKSNKAERDVVVAILGYCGVLETVEHPGYAKVFVPASEREIPSRRFVDMAYPACWWNRAEGINELRLSEYFGHVL